MSLKKVLQEIDDFFTEHLTPPFKVTSIQPTDQGWEAVVEVIEEKEYMKAYAKDEMLGVYQVTVNKDVDVTAFNRVGLRSRSAIAEEV